MKRRKPWLARWGSFLAGVCIGLLIIAPVLAARSPSLAAETIAQTYGAP